MIYLALHKKSNRLFDKLVRLWTGDEYSHCELVVDDMAYSSSFLDGGVRAKRIDFSDSSKWDLIPIYFAQANSIVDYYEITEGDGYGVLDLLLSQIFRSRFNVGKTEFCSEWCGNAINIPDARLHSPGSLARLVKHMNILCGKY